jgi:agmatine deiminase
VARHIIELTGAERIESELVNEGGGIHVNDDGDVLLTRTVQLDPGRNPNTSEQAVEDDIHQTLGTQRAIWFDRGLWRDYQDHGTRGHVDMIAAFAPDGSVLLHRQFDTNHPDHELWQGHCETLEAAGLQGTCTSRSAHSERQYGLGRLQLRQPLRRKWLCFAPRLQRSY